MDGFKGSVAPPGTVKVSLILLTQRELSSNRAGCESVCHQTEEILFL
jgi:hypothetical protein